MVPAATLLWTLLLSQVFLHPAATCPSEFSLARLQPLARHSKDSFSTLPTLPSNMSTAAAAATAVRFRNVARVIFAQEHGEGAGMSVRNSIGRREIPSLDPFLLMDEFTISPGAGFPEHPHRGQETVTYVFSGAVEHEDFCGHRGKVVTGGFQWMTAGKGIVHIEVPAAEKTHGLQIWINLPKAYKMCEPRYQDYSDKDILRAKQPGVEVKVVAGEAFGVRSKLETKSPILFLEFKMEPNTTVEQPVPEDYNAIVYTVEGKAFIGSEPSTEVPAHSTVTMTAGNTLRIQTKDSPARFLILGGRPLSEPVVHHGPFVMNTREDIQKAVMDYQTGRNGFERAQEWEPSIGRRRFM